MSTSRRKNLTIVALLAIGGHASQSAAFSTYDEHRLTLQTSLRVIEKRTTLNRLLPLSPLSSNSRCHPQKQKYLTTCMASTSHSQMSSMADLAVRLDSPILPPTNRSSELWKFAASGLVSQVFRTALITLAIALAIALVRKFTSSFINRFTEPLMQSLSHGYRVSRGRLLRIFDERPDIKNIGGTPMEFNDEEMDGWGVCTLSSREAVGRSQFVKYGFDLPRKDNTLELLSGQQVTLCYLDQRDNVAKGDYYLYSPPTSKGSFSIIVPKDKRTYAATGAAEESPDFAELSIGDELALQPGPETFQYNGQYFPITDMLHIVAGEGIAPVINQVKSVLPSGSSSLKLVKVVWMNESEKDFDVGQSTLEDDYYKYFKKLAVSCIVEDYKKNELWDNDEIVANIPRFNPGTMVVISGPRLFVSKAKNFLREIGYPDECICNFSTD